MLWNDSIRAFFQQRYAAMQAGGPECLLADLPLSAEAFLAWGLQQASGRTLVWIGDGPRTLDLFARDLHSLRPSAEASMLLFPPGDIAGGKTPVTGVAPATGDRLRTLSGLSAKTPAMVATCIQALLQPILSPSAIAAATLELKTGSEYETEALLQSIVQADYRMVPEVQSRGEAAVRGGLLDLWLVSEPWPMRFEFLGSLLESIRTFDPATQRSLQALPAVRLPLAPDAVQSPAARATLSDHLPPETIFVWSDLHQIEAHAEIYARATAPSDAGAATPPMAMLREKIGRMAPAFQIYTGTGPQQLVAPFPLDFKATHAIATADGKTRLPPDLLELTRQRYLEEIAARAESDFMVHLWFDTEGSRQRFCEVYGTIGSLGKCAHSGLPLSQGFSSDALRLLLIAESDLYGRRIRRRRATLEKGGQERTAGERISDWTDMEPGDLVVHVEHGIGRYLGLREITINNDLQEALAIEYAEQAKLYVPVAQAHLLTRYVGLTKRAVPLHPLGGQRWRREKQAALTAVADLAGQLLETQAARDTLQGHAFRPDQPWQHEMEAAFPYEETTDQIRAIELVKRDMEQTRPMDRLICGDAGFGKTEVAIRAAFKVVLDAKQVAILVPTTILAQQHFQTFTERLAPFPVTIGMLSRFCSATERNRVLAGLREGGMDIVIGTHGLLQGGVQFHDLGLVIIDEEQRFGVRHKERFKQIRRLVDVLTLTATPIPRTLYLSLTGARDLSTIQTPPQERLAVETIVAPDSDAVLREAILRELNREGQVYFVHNRVLSIGRVQLRLRDLIPEARMEVAHGQMPAGQLAEVMQRFSEGAFDVLISTTIVESGLDIPNANTILIDRADRFGLAELYQLRGRVGRSNQRGYAYMLLPERTVIDPTARRRIQAIRQYSELGAGFRLAMRDLEIRGAGNLLGHQQSGHITAVGFGLYCQLLKRTIALRKGEEAPPVIEVELRLDFIHLAPRAAEPGHAAFLPFTYIEDERLRVSIYRKIAEAAWLKDVDRLEEEFRDRFGPPPPPARRLLALTRLRIAAAAGGIQSIETRDDRIMCQRAGQYLMPDGRFPRMKKTNPDARLAELLALVKSFSPGVETG